MSKDQQLDNLDSYTDKSISLSDRYRKFVFLGFFREFMSNAVSIVSLFFIARIFVPYQGISDQMFFLSNSLGITGTIALLGYTYSLTRKAIVDKHLNSTILNQGTSFLFIIGIPINLILNLVLGIIDGISPIQLLLFLISSILYYIFLVIQVVEDIILQSNRNVLMQTLQNILSSLSVPIFFVLFKSLEIIFIAWIFSLSISLLYNYGLIFKILSNLKFNFEVNSDIFMYGFILYILAVYSLLSKYLDTPILRFFFQTGVLTEYTFAFRIATTVFELFTVLMTGSFPLLTNYYIRQEYNQFLETIKSLIKIGIMIGLFLFGFSFIGANFGLTFLLSSKYPEAPLYFNILILAFFIRITPLILQQVFSARGNRRFLAEISIIVSTTRIFYLILFAHLGGLGLAIVEVLYSITFLLVCSYRERKFLLDFIYSYPKFLVSVTILIITLLILPSSGSLIMISLIALIFLFIFIAVLYILKPFNMNDYKLIERIIGNKFNISLYFKKLFVTI